MAYPMANRSRCTTHKHCLRSSAFSQDAFWWCFLERYGNANERREYQPRLFARISANYERVLRDCTAPRSSGRVFLDNIFLKARVAFTWQMSDHSGVSFGVGGAYMRVLAIRRRSRTCSRKASTAPSAQRFQTRSNSSPSAPFATSSSS